MVVDTICMPCLLNSLIVSMLLSMKTVLDKKSSLIVSHKPVFVDIPNKDLFSNTRLFLRK